MTTLGVLLAVTLAVDLSPRRPDAEHAKQRTRCAACHTPEGWDRVAFDHAARTGFPLEGAHRSAGCRGCHRASDFKVAVPRACVACHRDAHAGRMGTRCADCHDAVAWKEPTFGPDAHRRTGFALDGRHAVVPCEECHGDRRGRSFSRATRTCAQCHSADLARAASLAFDHLASFGAAEDCRRCHGPWAFAPAYLPGHDVCFPIRSGTHAGIRCLQCHTSLPTPVPPVVTACTSGTAGCTRCHPCASYAARHTGVPGFTSQCARADSCWNCHPSGVAGGG